MVLTAEVMSVREARTVEKRVVEVRRSDMFAIGISCWWWWW